MNPVHIIGQAQTILVTAKVGSRKLYPRIDFISKICRIIYVTSVLERNNIFVFDLHFQTTPVNSRGSNAINRERKLFSLNDDAQAAHSLSADE